MRHAFYLAWRHLWYHRLRSLLLIACLALLAALPLALHTLTAAGEQQLLARAATSPLLLGGRGSAFDLMLNALYFQPARLPTITQQDADAIAASGLAEPLPLYVRFRLRGAPLVGITPDYLQWRGLQPAQGEYFTQLGECVLGHQAALRLGLKPGDRLPSAPENPFDLAGAYPLLLRVAGVLAPAGTPDDQAVFIDLKTAWIIDGIGHGHEAAPDREAPHWPAFGGHAPAAPPRAYSEITPDNAASFHFHGDPAHFPLSAVLAVPHDRKSSTLLRGRYLDPGAMTQMLVPSRLAATLLQTVFRLRALLDGICAVAGLAVLMALAVVFALSLKLRQAEIATMHLLGCSRYAAARLAGAECLLLAAGAGIGAWLLLGALRHYADALAGLFMLA